MVENATTPDTVQSCLRAGELDSAKVQVAKLLKATPRKPRLHLLHSEICLAEGRIAEAWEAWKLARLHQAKDGMLDRLAVRIAAVEQDWPAVIFHAEHLAGRGAGIPVWLTQHAHRAYAALNLWKRELAFLEQVLAQNPAAQRTVKYLYQTLFMLTPKNGLAEAIEARLFGPGGGAAHCAAFQAYSAAFGQLPPDIRALAERAAARWPDSAEVKMLQAQLQPAAAAAASPGAAPETQLRGALDRYISTPSKYPEELRKSVAQVIARDLEEKPFGRALLLDNGEAVQVSPPGSTGTSVLVFSGLGDHAFLPFGLLDAYFAALDVTAIYLRDASRNMFVHGIPGFAGNRRKTLDGLRKLLPGQQRLLALSASAGGLGAAYYGTALGAEKILMFAPVTNVTPQFMQSIGDTRGQIIQRRLARVRPLSLLDARAGLAPSAGETPVAIHFASGNAVDRHHAEYLASLPQVSLHPSEGNRRALPHELLLAGRFQEIVEQFAAPARAAAPEDRPAA